MGSGWNPSGGGGGGAPSGPAGGGLAGTYPNPTVAKAPSASVVQGTRTTIVTTAGKAKISATAGGTAVRQTGTYKTSYWYTGSASRVGATAGPLMTKGKLTFIPFSSPTAFIMTAIGVQVATAVATTTIRLGIYNDNGHGKPGALLFDLTTVLGTTTGVKTKAATHTLAAGSYWLVCVRQGTSTTGTLRCRGLAGANSGAPAWGVTAFTVVTAIVTWQSTASTFTGALPATAPAVSVLKGASSTNVTGIMLKSA